MGDLATQKDEVENLKKGIKEVTNYINNHTGTVDKPRTMSMDETYEVFEKLTKLLNS